MAPTGSHLNAGERCRRHEINAIPTSGLKQLTLISVLASPKNCTDTYIAWQPENGRMVCYPMLYVIYPASVKSITTDQHLQVEEVEFEFNNASTPIPRPTPKPK
eukprot:scaffold6422_cov69-Cyclotella_meneghiniana.AAC.3